MYSCRKREREIERERERERLTDRLYRTVVVRCFLYLLPFFLGVFAGEIPLPKNNPEKASLDPKFDPEDHKSCRN